MSSAAEPTRLLAVAEPALLQLVAVGNLLAGVCRAATGGPPLNERERALMEQLPAQWESAVHAARVGR